MTQEETWSLYSQSWGAEGEDKKRNLFAQCLSKDCRYADPLTTTQGWDELVQYMLDFHQKVPGGHFHTVKFQNHHDRCLVDWEMRSGDKNVVGTGTSFGEFGTDGKLRSMNGFFQVEV